MSNTSPQSRRFKVRLRGPLACFTRPEMKVERVSYEVITPSAVRGAIEAVLWKPAIRWQVHRIWVLSPIAWTSFRRNEVNSRMVAGKTDYYADEDRSQRNTVALRDVDYVAEVSFSMVAERRGPEDNVRKFEEMFERRLERGQCFQTPYLGCREFPAEVSPAPEGFEAIAVDRPLGLMFFDFEYGDERTRPLFFAAELKRGVLDVPSRDAVIAENEVAR